MTDPDESVARAFVGKALNGFEGIVWTRPKGHREFETWIVDDTWVVRIARTPRQADKLERERATLEEAELPVAVPQIERWSRGVAVHRILRGITADPPATAWETIAAQIAATLSALHAMPLRVAVRARLETREDEPPAQRLEWLARARDDLHDEDLPRRARAFLDDPDLQDTRSARPVISHYDLKGEHVLLSVERLRVVGLIDWADVCVSGPEADFTGLVMWLGPRFAKLVAERYEFDVDLDVAISRARTWSLIRLGRRVARNRPKDLARALVRVSFEDA